MHSVTPMAMPMAMHVAMPRSWLFCHHIYIYIYGGKIAMIYIYNIMVIKTVH